MRGTQAQTLRKIDCYSDKRKHPSSLFALLFSIAFLAVAFLTVAFLAVAFPTVAFFIVAFANTIAICRSVVTPRVGHGGASMTGFLKYQNTMSPYVTCLKTCHVQNSSICSIHSTTPMHIGKGEARKPMT